MDGWHNARWMCMWLQEEGSVSAFMEKGKCQERIADLLKLAASGRCLPEYLVCSITSCLLKVGELAVPSSCLNSAWRRGERGFAARAKRGNPAQASTLKCAVSLVFAHPKL